MRSYNHIVVIGLLIALLNIGCSADSYHDDSNRQRDIAYLWSLSKDNSVAIKEVATIRGMVVANDKLNEVTHRIVVVDGSGGIEMAIDAENIDNIIPLYSTIEINVSGLYIGRQGRKCVLGTRPTGEYVVDRVAERDLPLYITSCDHEELIEATPMRIANVESRHLLHYICLDGVRFIDEEVGLAWCDRNAEGRHIESIRHLTDGTDTMRVVCSAECSYASAKLPSGMLHCYGIVDYAQGDLALRIVDGLALSSPTR